MCKVVCFGCAENISLAEFKRVKWCFFYNSESFVRVFRAFRGYLFLRFSSFQGLVTICWGRTLYVKMERKLFLEGREKRRREKGCTSEGWGRRRKHRLYIVQ